MDVAALNLQIDSSSVVKAANDLERFSAAAAKAGAASGNQSGSIAKLVATVQSMNAKLAAIVSALDKVNNALSSMGKASQGAATANDNVARAVSNADAHVIAYTQHLAANLAAARAAASAQQSVATEANDAARAFVNADAHVIAYRDHLRRLAATPVAPSGANSPSETLKKTGDAAQLASQHVSNLAYQFNDVVVSLASGQNPLMVFIQQGSQIGQIYGQSGLSLRGFAAAIAGMLAPLAPLIVALGLAVAAIAALTKQANDDSGLKKYTTSMGYTKAEVAKLNAVTVTFGDTMKAVFQVGFERIASAFGVSTGDIKKAWQSVMDFLIAATRNAVAVIYSLNAGLAYAIKRTYDNIRAGTAENPFSTLMEGYKSAYGDAQKFMDDVVKQARANAQKRQSDMAKAMFDAPTDRSANRLASILQGAQGEIAAENARAEAIGLSARAAAELEQRTKLLNQIEKAGIPITDGLRAKVDALSKAYADAKVAADTAAAVQGVVDGLQKQSDAINDQLSLVGLYGDALTRARIEMDALAKARDALPKGEVLSPEEAGRIMRGAQPVASDQINLDRATRMEQLRKDAEDAAYALDLERKGLGLAGAAAESYAFVTDRLNEAKRQGIDLSPDEIAAIKAAGDAYGATRYAIDQQAQAIADAREVTKGFFSDWINGVRDGANLFKSFADSVIASLNRIIDKLLDNTLNSFLNNISFGSLLGGGTRNAYGISGASNLYALGGTFGTAQRFANGGAFTNRIVNTPTLFRFANGAALGEMGEAGPEAVMPLKRGPDGSLGVRAHGGRGQKPQININNNYSFAGAVGLDSIVSMVRQGGEATYNQVKRDLQSLLQQLDNDGAFAS